MLYGIFFFPYFFLFISWFQLVSFSSRHSYSHHLYVFFPHYVTLLPSTFWKELLPLRVGVTCVAEQRSPSFSRKSHPASSLLPTMPEKTRLSVIFSFMPSGRKGVSSLLFLHLFLCPTFSQLPFCFSHPYYHDFLKVHIYIFFSTFQYLFFLLPTTVELYFCLTLTLLSRIRNFLTFPHSHSVHRFVLSQYCYLGGFLWVRHLTVSPSGDTS